jgi:hypothetical protein
MSGGGRTERRNDWVLSLCLLMPLLSVLPSFRHLSAQVSVQLAAGVRYSSTLVHDSIVTPLDLRPALAPTLLLSARHDLNPGWSADVSLDVSPSGLRRHEAGASFDAGAFTAVAFTVALRHDLAPGLSARAGAGGLRYATAQTGVFRQGSGGLFPLLTVAATYAPTLGARRGLAVEARYDLHQFITPALRSTGFTDPRPVHRIALTLSARVVGRGQGEGRAP